MDEAEITKSLLESNGIQAEITVDENIVRDWTLETTGDGFVNVLILYGAMPNTIYPVRNTQPDGSVAENWIETLDGDTILNHADYFGFNGVATIQSDNELGDVLWHANGPAGLQNLMDIPNIVCVDEEPTPVLMLPTSDGKVLTPSLVSFGSFRVLPLNRLQGDWFAEKVFASDTGNAKATRADPVIVRDGNRGRLAIAYQTNANNNIGKVAMGEVAAEIIINYLLAE